MSETWDWVLVERANRMRASGYWSMPALSEELGVPLRTLYRMIHPCLKRGEVWVFPEGFTGGAEALRRWHRKLKRLGLPRDGSVTVRDGQVVETGRRDTFGAGVQAFWDSVCEGVK